MTRKIDSTIHPWCCEQMWLSFPFTDLTVAKLWRSQGYWKQYFWKGGVEVFLVCVLGQVHTKESQGNLKLATSCKILWSATIQKKCQFTQSVAQLHAVFTNMILTVSTQENGRSLSWYCPWKKLTVSPYFYQQSFLSESPLSVKLWEK